MKKSAYFLFILIILGSCKFDENTYSIYREYDGGTFITPEGVVKYISCKDDSAKVVRDNYAEIMTEINYIRLDSSGNNADNILIWGHCFAESPETAIAIDPELWNPGNTIIGLSQIQELEQNSVIDFNDPGGTGVPTDFAPRSVIDAGKEWTNILGLKYETEYNIRSFVVTGYFDTQGNPVYEDIAYNQSELNITTIQPEDRWVCCEDEEPIVYYGGLNKGAISFQYDGYMFVGLGRTETPLGATLNIYRYDPVSNTWDEPYLSRNVGTNNNFSDAVAFVIEDVDENDGILHDYVYIGTGLKEDGEATEVFWRLELNKNLGADLGQWGEWKDITTPSFGDDFPGTGLSNAVAFTINGIGYVGFGQLDVAETPVSDFYKFDPEDRKAGEHEFGKWTFIGHFANASSPSQKEFDRTGACLFQIGEFVYLGLGKDGNGNYQNDLWLVSQNSDGSLKWTEREEFPGKGRYDAVGFSLGENGYMGSGWDGDSARSDFYRYTPFNNSWEQRARYLGEARYAAVGEGIVLNNGTVFKGYLGTGWNGSEYFDDFWHYRP
jgi:N-acetylneuraminic acid mutarotase